MIEQKNIIKKLDVEINTHSMEHALHLKDNISEFIMEKIYPQLEKYFDELHLPDSEKIYRIDDLTIEFFIETNTLLNHHNILLNNKLNKLSIESLLSDEKTSVATVDNFATEEIPVRALLYFLRNGTLPWWHRNAQIFSEKTLKILLETSKFRIEFERLMQRKIFRKRLIYQAPKKALFYLVKSLLTPAKHNVKFSDFPKEIEVYFSDLGPLSEVLIEHAINTSIKDDSRLVRRLASVLIAHSPETDVPPDTFLLNMGIAAHILNTFYDGKESLRIVTDQSNSEQIEFTSQELKTLSHENVRAKIAQIVGLTETLNEESISLYYGNQLIAKGTDSGIEIVDFPLNEENIWNEELGKENLQEEFEDGILVANAGLLLLHPFLKMFFKNVGVIDGNEIKKDKQDLAVHLLHYLGCGHLQPSEHQLIFEKYLCNIPLKFPVKKDIYISEKEKEACDELLLAVLGHWTALKSKSAELLRNEFLSREGKLVLDEDNDKVFIERRTMDILLEKLPWNIGIVQLPWKEKLISVQW